MVAPAPPPPVNCASADSRAVEIFGWLGCMCAWILFLSPVLTVRKIVRAGTVASFSPLPYLVSALQCGLWIVYALPMVTPCKLQPEVTNIIGFALELGYVLVFVRYARNRWAMAARATAVVLTIAVVAVLCVYWVPSQEWIPLWPDAQQSRASNVLGLVCLVFNICMYAAPLSVVRMVVAVAVTLIDGAGGFYRPITT